MQELKNVQNKKIVFSLVEKEGSVLNFMGFSFFYIHQSRCLFFTTFLYNTLHLTKCFKLRHLVARQYFTSELVFCCLDSGFIVLLFIMP